MRKLDCIMFRVSIFRRSDPAPECWRADGAPNMPVSAEDKHPEKASLLHCNIFHVAQQVVDLVYPPACIACRRATSQHGVLCAKCWGQTPFIERPYCERLGTPFAQDLGHGIISPDAFANPPVYHRARAVARFEAGPVREMVHRLKYGDRLELAKPMGQWMARAGAELLADADLIVPVPLHRWRLFGRRFNQAAVLATEVSRASGVECNPLILERVRRTIPQVGLTRAQRADNVQGAFRVPIHGRERLRGLKIVLVDDVMTSGATANAAARILLRAGALRVDALVFARVVTDGMAL